MFQSPSPIVFDWMCFRHGRSSTAAAYGWNPTVSIRRFVRPDERNASPTPRMNAPGEVDPESSFPVEDSASPITFTFENDLCRTSQQRASSASYSAGAFVCGFQNSRLFGSFQSTTSRIDAQRFSTLLT